MSAQNEKNSLKCFKRMIDVSYLAVHLTGNIIINVRKLHINLLKKMCSLSIPSLEYILDTISKIIVLDVPGHVICDFPGVPAHQMFQLLKDI